jgi:hypothetical protein
VYRILVAFLLVFVISYGFASAQEPRFATYHEIASVIVDQRLSNNVTASVSLQTTSIQEFQIPPELDAKIRNNTNIVAVVITNEDQCVLGVQDQICVMVNVRRISGEGGIKAVQQSARDIGDSLIDDINSAFGLDTTFHSVFIHYDDKINEALGTTGEVSGAGTVSAVYTSSMQSTDFLFNKISGILIPRQIRSMGGFYDVAQQLSLDDNSRITFTILPKDQGSIMQLKVALDYPNTASEITKVDPLKFLKVDQITKSQYFSVGFFPLNSLVHVVILPADNSTRIHTTSVIEPTIKNGQKVPSDLTKSGWFFSSDSGTIEAMYLFGEGFSASRDDLVLSFDGKAQPPEMTTPNQMEVYLLVGIGIAAAGAAAFYLKGIKRKS